MRTRVRRDACGWMWLQLPWRCIPGRCVCIKLLFYILNWLPTAHLHWLHGPAVCRGAGVYVSHVSLFFTQISGSRGDIWRVYTLKCSCGLYVTQRAVLWFLWSYSSVEKFTMFAQLSVLNENKIMLLLKCATWMNFIYYFWTTANISRTKACSHSGDSGW